MRAIYQTFSPFFSNRTLKFNPGTVLMGLVVDNAALDMFFFDFSLHWACSSSIFLHGAFFSIFCTGYVLHQLFALDMLFDFFIFCIDIFTLCMFFLHFFYTGHALRLIWQLPFFHYSIIICHEALKHTDISSVLD